MPSLLFWVFFAALVFSYLMGCASVYLYQWLNLRWIARHTRQPDDDENEGYTLTIVQRPQSDDEGA